MSFVVWITGLPGSGKSTLALLLKERIPDTVVLRMDELRKTVTPEPTYSDEEREHVYRAIVYTAKTICDLSHNVIIDATGNKKSWRQLARQTIQEFFEIYLQCPVELCMEREKTRTDTHAAPAGIYEKGKAGWPVPGIRIPYEEPEKPEMIIDTEKESPEDAVERIVKMIQKQK
jgi:adenylylsulfate kinase